MMTEKEDGKWPTPPLFTHSLRGRDAFSRAWGSINLTGVAEVAGRSCDMFPNKGSLRASPRLAH